MPRYEIEKHPDYYKTEKTDAWLYLLLALAILFLIWLLSKFG